MCRRMLLLVGVLLVLCPFIANSFAEQEYQSIIEEYENRIREQDKEQVMSSDYAGTIGWIEIPCIQVLLPIYHGTKEDILQKGIGHISSSSLPGGGSGTHCCLAGHRGLPHTEMFARLGEVQISDVFYLHVFQEVLAYEVCDIKVVSPTQTELLRVQPQRELVSLVTCTPYGINSHRLIVTGERKEGT